MENIVQTVLEKMVQSLRVDTGHCNYNMLLMNVWVQVTPSDANAG